MPETTPETIIARIQVRRGELDDLPVLEEGEFGYALDYNRLFIGNTPAVFTADGTTNRFTIYSRSIIPGQMRVLLGTEVDDEINYVEQVLTQDYNIQNTDIVFAETPTAGQIIKISYNTELSVVNQRVSLDRIELENSVTDQDLGISWSLANFNSASIEYSLRNTNNEFNIGTIKVITDGTSISVVDNGSGIGDSQITFDGRIADNRLYMTYSNPTTYNAYFHYNIQLWNTL